MEMCFSSNYPGNDLRNCTKIAEDQKHLLVSEGNLEIQCIRVEIPRYFYSSKTRSIVYIIHTNLHGIEWTFERRYRSFKHFHKMYQKYIPTSISKIFPSSWRMFPPRSEDALSRRRALLQTYLQAVLNWLQNNSKSILSKNCITKENIYAEIPFLDPFGDF